MSDVHTQNSYNLPCKYDDNKVVLMAKDPNWLYAYWEVSESRKNDFIEQFGNKLWEKSIPVLKIINVSNNTSFYIRISEFSNNWYINVPNPDSLYIAELGRQITEQFFVNLATSNYVTTPRAAISTNTGAYFINYRDLRSGKFNFDTREIYESYNYKFDFSKSIGISSPELLRNNFQQSALGISSAELLAFNFSEHFGISSASFFKESYL